MKRAFTIYYDEGAMELGGVDIGKGFSLENALSRADILKDCYEYIIEAYNAALLEWEKEIGGMNGNIAPTFKGYPESYRGLQCGSL